MIEDFALLDTILSDSMEEMKALLLNIPEKDYSKIQASNEIDFSLMNKVLPIEILKKILEQLDVRSVCLAKQTCKYWNEIICK